MNLMVAIFFGFSILVYGTFTWLTFNDSFRQSNYYPWSGILYALLASISWVLLVKNLTTHSQIIYYSIVWDVIMVIIGVLIPILFYKAQFSNLTYFGFLFIIIGMIFLKWGDIEFKI